MEIDVDIILEKVDSLIRNLDNYDDDINIDKTILIDVLWLSSKWYEKYFLMWRICFLEDYLVPNNKINLTVELLNLECGFLMELLSFIFTGFV